MRLRDNSYGVSIIAAIFIIVILGFMGVMFVSLIGTGSLTAVNDMQSDQALYIAEGGMEYILENRVFPNYSMGAVTLNLGAAGRFTVSTPTYLTADPGVAGVTINVQSTANFPAAGRIIIDSEQINYTGKGANSFTGATRGVGGTAAAAHTAGNSVYPVTTVTDNPLAAGNATINVTSNVGFSIPGVIIIDSEYIYCGRAVGLTQFQNCSRGYKGSGDVAHTNLSPVFQYAITSTGTVGSAERAVTRSVRSQGAGAMMAYAKLNGDRVPYYRRWDGTAWGPELMATPLTAGTTIQYMVLKFARTRNEAILGTMDSAGRIQVQVWDGAAWGPTVPLATVGADSAYRGFDIEYETFGDRAFVVFNDTTPDPNFVIWDGIGWSAVGNIDIPTSGRTRWIELAPNPRNNELCMIILDSNADVYGRCRVGGTWNNPLEAPLGPWDNAASTADSKVIDVAYEHQTGRAMFIWARNVNRTMRFRIWNGATVNLGLVTDQNIANIGNHTAMWARLASDPYSDRIMLGIQDSGSDLITSLWDGVVWDANGTQHDNSLEDQSRNFDLAYETAAANAGSAWLLWGNGTRLSRRQWNGAAWGATANAGDDTSYINIVAHPLSGAVFSAMYESTGSATDDIWESHLTSGGAIWSARFTVWGGPTVASPVREKVCLAAERFSLLSNPLIVLDWNEVVR